MSAWHKLNDLITEGEEEAEEKTLLKLVNNFLLFFLNKIVILLINFFVFQFDDTFVEATGHFGKSIRGVAAGFDQKYSYT